MNFGSESHPSTPAESGASYATNTPHAVVASEGTAPAEHANCADVVASARQRLVKHPHLTQQRIWCDYAGGRLLLRGQVPSFYYKQLAQEAMTNLVGVCQIVNDIEVVW